MSKNACFVLGSTSVKLSDDSELVNRLLEGVLEEQRSVSGARSAGGVTIRQGVCEGDDFGQKLYRFLAPESLRARADTPVTLCTVNAEGVSERYEGTVRSYSHGSLLLSLSRTTVSAIHEARLELGVEELVLQRASEALRCLRDGAVNGDVFNRDIAQASVKGPSRSALAGREIEIPTDLTEDQQAACKRALSSRVSYIWGPAGTGKTTTLGALAYQLFSEHRRVLIVAHTNQAVDGVLREICMRVSRSRRARIPEGSIVRLGHISREDLRQDFGDEITLDSLVSSGRQKMTDRLAAMQRELADVERRVWKFGHRQVLLEHRAALESERRELVVTLQGIGGSRGAHGELNAGLSLIEASLREIERNLGGSAVDAGETSLTDLLERQKDLSGGIELLESFLQDIRSHVISRARVVALTSAKAVLNLFTLGTFDAVVIDEASMMPLPMSYLVAGLAKERVVIVGDFRQLPPIARAENEKAKSLYATSPFESSGISRSGGSGGFQHLGLATLTSQFRSHPDVLEMFNGRFYGGVLRSAFKGDKPLTCQTKGGSALSSLLASSRVVLVDTSSLSPQGYYLSGSKANGVHALIVRGIVQELTSGKMCAGRDIGVIAPYRPQVDLIHSLLREGGTTDVTCGTVHRFQGDERRLMVLDFTESAPHKIGAFLSGTVVEDLGARLLNVALSRAQGYLLLVADVRYLHRMLSSDSLVSGLLRDITTSGRALDAAELLSGSFDGIGTVGQEILSLEHSILQRFSVDDFYAGLVADLLEAKSEVVFFSPHVDTRGISVLQGVVAGRGLGRLSVTVRLGVGGVENNAVVGVLRSLGATVETSTGAEAALSAVVIDREVVWCCSTPPLVGNLTEAAKSGVCLRSISPSLAGFLTRTFRSRATALSDSSGISAKMLNQIAV